MFLVTEGDSDQSRDESKAPDGREERDANMEGEIKRDDGGNGDDVEKITSPASSVSHPSLRKSCNDIKSSSRTAQEAMGSSHEWDEETFQREDHRLCRRIHVTFIPLIVIVNDQDTVTNLDGQIFIDYVTDPASVLTEVGPDDFPSFFEARDGRLFHSRGGSPYPLPVDTPETNVPCPSYLKIHIDKQLS